MKSLVLPVVAVFILIVSCLTPWWLPTPERVGKIIEIKEAVRENIPIIPLTLETQSGITEAVMYESQQKYELGDQVRYETDQGIVIVSERYRLPALYMLFGIFVAVVLLVSGYVGMRAILGLGFSFIVIFRFVLPQILQGSSPLLVALLASVVILMVSYFLSHGVNAKSVLAIIGTFGALVVTAILASLFGSLSGLTGMGSEEAGFLLENLPRDRFYPLLLAGMIIGSLGVLDDITISQASIVAELKATNHRLQFGELFARAMRIGHDHIASLVNTLVLVYAGSALPLLLLFVASDIGYVDLLSYEALAEEIVRTLVSSVGLITAVPLTTMIASYYYTSKR